MSNPALPFAREFYCTLEAGAGRAARSDTPIRLWFSDGHTFAEVFFFRDMLLHAEVNGLYGIAAVAAMIGADLRFAVDPGVWPRQCSMARVWKHAARDALAVRREPAARPRDLDDETARL